ncbi:MAG: hypothetical protein JRN52_05960 [Nitrososphaerota archaeon]|nr:hypothetical protein [Nitrososphaerota archaeon]
MAPNPARQEAPLIGYSSFVTLIVPIAALLAALLSGSLLLLDYVHVITGATWTGIDIFMGIVMSRILRSLAPPSRVEFIKKLVPIMLFLMPALASVAITAGVYMAGREGLSFLSPQIIAAGIVVIILSVQGFAVLLPTEVRIFLELRKANPSTDKIVKLGMRNIYLSGSQAVFQIVLIFIMATLAMAP